MPVKGKPLTAVMGEQQLYNPGFTKVYEGYRGRSLTDFRLHERLAIVSPPSTVRVYRGQELDIRYFELGPRGLRTNILKELPVCPWTTRQLDTPPINLPVNPGLGSVSDCSSPITAVKGFPFTGVS